MTFLEKIKMIDRLDGLIRRKSTGGSKELAIKVGVSERCIFDILQLMKNMGAPIIFDSSRGCYMYEYEVEFSLGFILSDKCQNGTQGGRTFNVMNLMLIEGNFNL